MSIQIIFRTVTNLIVFYGFCSVTSWAQPRSVPPTCAPFLGVPNWKGQFTITGSGANSVSSPGREMRFRVDQSVQGSMELGIMLPDQFVFGMIKRTATINDLEQVTEFGSKITTTTYAQVDNQTLTGLMFQLDSECKQYRFFSPALFHL